VTTLRDLIERSYIKQVHGSPNYDLAFDKETIDGKEARRDRHPAQHNAGKEGGRGD